MSCHYIFLDGLFYGFSDEIISDGDYLRNYNDVGELKATWSVRGFLFILQNHVIRYKLYLLQSRLAITRLAITRIGYNAVGRGPRISAARGEKWALQLTITL